MRTTDTITRLVQDRNDRWAATHRYTVERCRYAIRVRDAHLDAAHAVADVMTALALLAIICFLLAVGARPVFAFGAGAAVLAVAWGGRRILTWWGLRRVARPAPQPAAPPSPAASDDWLEVANDIAALLDARLDDAGECVVGGLRAVEEERERLRERRDALAGHLDNVLSELGSDEKYMDSPEAARLYLARIRAEGPEPGPTREELADAVEPFAARTPAADSGMQCKFCGGTKRPDPLPDDNDSGFLHWPDCAWVAARSLLSRMGRKVEG